MATDGNKKKKGCFIGCLSVILVVFGLYAFIILLSLIPLYKSRLEKHKFRVDKINYLDKVQKACHSNCKIIMEGIEEYNKEHPSDPVEQINYTTNDDDDNDNDELVVFGKVVKTSPDKKCHYWYAKERAEVYCTWHGSSSQPWNYEVMGVSPGDSSSPFSEKHRKYVVRLTEEKRDEVLKTKIFHDFPEKYFEFFFSPVFILLGLTIFRNTRFI